MNISNQDSNSQDPNEIIDIKYEKKPKDRDYLFDSNNENKSNPSFDVVQWIYEFLLTKEPIALKYLLAYVQKLDLNFKNPWLYKIFLVCSLVIDMLFAFILQFVIIILIAGILYSILRGLGLETIFEKIR
ncbi:MAG: hypothetical protein ACRCXZ_07425 [Patescibacteria group bacterium]